MIALIDPSRTRLYVKGGKIRKIGVDILRTAHMKGIICILFRQIGSAVGDNAKLISMRPFLVATFVGNVAPDSTFENNVIDQSIYNCFDAFAGLAIRQHGWPATTHHFAFFDHALEICSDKGRKVGLVDDQKIAAQDSRAAFARNIVAARDIDHEQPVIDKIEREGRGEIVAAGFDEHEIQLREQASSCSIAWMFRVGSSRIAVCGQAPVSTAMTRPGSIRPDAQPFGILVGDEIVGDDGDIDVAGLKAAGSALDKRGLAGSDRSADADAGGSRQRASCGAHRSM